jgi:hypothetical protein
MAAKQHNNSSAAASTLSSSSVSREFNSHSHNNNNSNNYNDIAVWIYVPKIQYTAYANTSCPIIQSYIDIIIRGCLSISHDFAKQFLLTTHGWSNGGCNDDSSDNNEKGDAANKIVVRSDEEEAGSTTNTTNSSSNVGSSCHNNNNMWVNDRSLPIYTRADVDYSLTHGQLIDELIEEYHKYALQHRIDI